MATRKKTKKKAGAGGRRPGAGRKARFGEPTVPASLHLPASFWAILEEIGGSRTDAFCTAIEDDELVERMREVLRQSGESS